jgi:hypothetical protein
VVVPELVKSKYKKGVDFKYYTKEEAEKMMRGWHNAKIKTHKVGSNTVYEVWANGQGFPFSKENVELIMTQVKKVTIEEIK